VLIYGHYDVQPAEPISEWRTPPFQPAIVGQSLFARGSADDKGPLFAHIKALGAFLRSSGTLPVNVRCLLEGEEEIGSPTLAHFLSRFPKRAQADVALMSDTRMLGTDRPALTYGLRGSLALEVSIDGPRHDLHAGHFGGVVHNPLQVLCEVIGGLHDRTGRVAIAGFYDRVRRHSRDDAKAVPDDAEILRNAAAPSLWGEPGYSAYERTTVRPALTLNGLSGGYQGPGGKSVIPARASAKLSFRLVPDQDPAEVERLFRTHIARVVPRTVLVSVKTLSSARPVLINPSHPAMQAAALACRRAFGTAPAVLRSGGTIPVVELLQRHSVPTVLLGLTLPDARIHAPNEHLHLPTFHRGIAASIEFLTALGTWRRRHADRVRSRTAAT
jgi:acetylornithine deacetylase/succinyl-diaminopimelate desuccinylase-like protein